MFHYFMEVKIGQWLDEKNKAAKHMVSPMMYFISSHYYLQDFCKEVVPDMDASKCAFVIGYFKSQMHFDRVIPEDELDYHYKRTKKY
jgi:hypothetical protein